MGVRVGKETETEDAKVKSGAKAQTWASSGPQCRTPLCNLSEEWASGQFLHTPKYTGSSVPHLSSSGLCLCSRFLPGRRSFTPLGQGQPPVKSMSLQAVSGATVHAGKASQVLHAGCGSYSLFTYVISSE